MRRRGFFEAFLPDLFHPLIPDSRDPFGTFSPPLSLSLCNFGELRQRRLEGRDQHSSTCISLACALADWSVFQCALSFPTPSTSHLHSTSLVRSIYG
ncbi:hypothetical protein PHBOTO_002309 [Pseudozyma hubeiensis]|nr:hypothetical protein PHBOTO_002309 [Pseudozyma hubeiensis]